MISFTVKMKPVAKARARTGKGFAYTPKKTVDAEKKIAGYGLEAMLKAGLKPLSGPIAMDLEFVIAPTGSWSKKKKAEALSLKGFPVSRPDLDNYCKLVSDALNGVCYNDDSQIVKLNAKKVFGPHDKVVIHIEELQGDGCHE